MNNYIKVFYISIIFILIAYTAHGQVIIDNTSFEGTPADATMPAGWFAGTKGTTPDILPGYWGVYTEPEDGDSYVGMITREDGSYESISQRLTGKVIEGSCYSMSLYMAFSDNYTGYNNPIHLRIWMSDIKNERQQLIYTSPLIKSEDWKKFNFDFTPETDKYYIILEAYISDEPKAHKGNILIDKISPIYFCNRA